MKRSFKLKVLKSSKTLTEKEQEAFRLKFKPLLNLNGIISLCIEAKDIFVEFNAKVLNLEAFKQILIENGFPLESKIKSVSL